MKTKRISNKKQQIKKIEGKISLLQEELKKVTLLCDVCCLNEWAVTIYKPLGEVTHLCLKCHKEVWGNE